MVNVSVIVPIYNTERYIERCLKSLVNQSLKDIEIICVNDGSTDNSIVIVRKFADNDSRIKIIEQQNLKQGAARNNGMKIATGEYIGFIDSDDWIDIDYFEKLYNAAKKYNSDIAVASHIRIGNGKTKKRVNITEEKFYKSNEEKFFVCNQLKNECPTNKIYRQEFIKRNNIVWPEGILCEDKIFTTQAIYFSNGVVSVPGINYYYYRNPVSTIHTEDSKNSKNEARLSVLKFLRKKNLQFADKKYWAIQKDIPSKAFPLIRIKESVITKRIYLFSFLLVGEMSL